MGDIKVELAGLSIFVGSALVCVCVWSEEEAPLLDRTAFWIFDGWWQWLQLLVRLRERERIETRHKRHGRAAAGRYDAFLVKVVMVEDVTDDMPRHSNIGRLG